MFKLKLATVSIDHATHGPRAKFTRGIEPSRNHDECIERFHAEDQQQGDFIVRLVSSVRFKGLFEVRDHTDQSILSNRQVMGTMANQNGILRIPLGQVLKYQVDRKILYVGNICYHTKGSWLQFGTIDSARKMDPFILSALRSAHEVQEQLVLAK